MVEEYNSIMVSDVWEVVPRPQDRSVIGSRWIYKIKYAVDGSVEKYKARFVAKGYAQKEGIDYEKTFAPVARYTSIRTVISLATQMGWEIHQMDVKTTFLNGVIEEEAPRAWYGRIDGYLQKMGFVKSDADPNLYCLVVENEPLILVLYVDDLFLTGSSRLIGDCKKNLATEFDMKDLGRMHYFLGLQLIRSLMYLVNTRPDICYAVNTLSQFIVEPKRAHWAAAKHVLRYLQGTVDYGLLYTKGKDIRLSGFTDANWAGSSVD
eukprot:PITA_01731